MSAELKCPFAGSPLPPSYEVDFYGDEVICAPWDHYRRMRDLGAVVWLPRQGNFAVTRHAEAQQVLRDWRLFSSAEGVAGDAVGCAFLKGNTLASDPPIHDDMRKAMGEPLLPRSLEQWRSRIEAIAEELIEKLVRQGSFDGMRDFARSLPLTVVTELVGLPDDGRENMLTWANASFDILGEQNERGRQGMETIKEMRHWIATKASGDRLKAGSWTARIRDLAEAGMIPAEFVPQLIRDYINPSLDTTISATGQLLYQLGSNPDQWSKLRDSPSFVPQAVDEAVRLASPIRSFSRTLAREARIGEVDLPAGARIMVLFASANRDERRYTDPDRFDVGRDNADHLGFGHGIHTCVGMHLARMEMMALLKAMLPRVERIAVGRPTIALNNTIYNFADLPATFHAIEDRHLDLRTLEVKVVKRNDVADGIVALELQAVDGAELPAFTAGSHVDVNLPNGLVRQYSLSTDPRDRSHYRLGVLRDPNSRGGSVAVHDSLHEGVALRISAPRNLFELNEIAEKSILLAGGIGITPVLAMAYRLHALGREFELHYAVRSLDRAAFIGEMRGSGFGDRVSIHDDSGTEDQRFNAGALVGTPDAGKHLYCCGPSGFIEAVTSAAKRAGWADANVHVERFSVAASSGDQPVQVVAQRSGITVDVAADETLLDALRARGIEIESSCEAGACGTCLVNVLEGTPDHRDMYQTDDEKASNRQMTVCCSRALTPRLVLDI